MNKTKKIIIASIAVLTVFLGSFMANSSEGNVSIALNTDRATAIVDDMEYNVSATPILYKYNTYVPMDDVLKLLGYEVGWDGDTFSTVAKRYQKTYYIMLGDNAGVLWIDNDKFEINTPPIYYQGVEYISLEMLAKMFDDSIYIVGTPTLIRRDLRDTLEDTYINDNYRLEGQSYSVSNGISLFGTTGMELLNISESSALDYASVVNTVANCLPGAKVYDIAVPTACEFYAPKSKYTNQTKGIKTIYSNLNSNVMPINVVKPLMEHAGEYIYFKTDHHWTQRGAYYAYKEFCDVAGMELPPLEQYPCVSYYGYVGSLARFTKGSYIEGVLNSHPDLLEKFGQLNGSRGAAYNDQGMGSLKNNVSLVNTSYNTYMAFIGGDNPVARFITDVDNGKKLVVIKESFGNAFASWAGLNYQYIYVVDPRQFNGFDGNNEPFNLINFYNDIQFDDLVIINYPGTISSSKYKNSLLKMVGK